MATPSSSDYSKSISELPSATSQQKRKTPKTNYNFVKEPGPEYFCPINKKLLLQPHKTLCCNYRISKQAGDRLIREKEPCPSCEKDSFDIKKDYIFKNEVWHLKVHCSYHKNGCKWIGYLWQLIMHTPTCLKIPLNRPFQTTHDSETTNHISDPISGSVIENKPSTTSEQKQQTVQTNYVFVDELGPEYFCPVSKQLLLEPCETACCGRYISKQVADRALTKYKKPCPLCKDENIVTAPDNIFKQKVHQLKVYCMCKMIGCKWTGELNKHQEHTKTCLMRPWNCPYCELSSTHHPGTIDLYHDGTIPFSLSQRHLLICPSLQPVKCEFAWAGCEVMPLQKDLADHMIESGHDHFMMTARWNMQVTTDLQEKMEQKDEYIAQLQTQIQELKELINTKFQEERDKQIANLQRQLQELEDKIDIKFVIESDEQITQLQELEEKVETKFQEEREKQIAQLQTKVQELEDKLDVKLQEEKDKYIAQLQAQIHELEEKVKSECKIPQRRRQADCSITRARRKSQHKVAKRRR